MVFFRFFVCMNFHLSRVTLLVLSLASGLPLSVVGREAPAMPAAKTETAKREPRERGSAAKDDYLLQPGDVIRVLVLGEEDLNKLGEVRLSQEFTVVLPLIGSVDLKGMTVRQTETIVRDLYDRDYLVKPQVNVSVVKYAERVVKVFGSVNKPGNVPFPPEEGLTLSGAISGADGFSRLADQKKVTLTRVLPDGTTDTKIFNLADMLKGRSGTDDIALQPNDTINVGERIL